MARRSHPRRRSSGFEERLRSGRGERSSSTRFSRANDNGRLSDVLRAHVLGLKVTSYSDGEFANRRETPQGKLALADGTKTTGAVWRTLAMPRSTRRVADLRNEHERRFANAAESERVSREPAWRRGVISAGSNAPPPFKTSVCGVLCSGTRDKL